MLSIIVDFMKDKRDNILCFQKMQKSRYMELSLKYKKHHTEAFYIFSLQVTEMLVNSELKRSVVSVKLNCHKASLHTSSR